MPKLAKKLPRYLFTGGAAAVVDIEGFRLLTAIGVPIIAAAVCSFVIAAIANFLLTSRWVFHTIADRVVFLTFLAGALLGMLVNVAITSASAILFELPRTLAKTLAVGLTFLLNFWINVRFVFRPRAESR